MPKTKPLSKVEQYALVQARDRMQESQVKFNELIGEVMEAHYIKPEAGPDWEFSRDFGAMLYAPQPKEEKKPDPTIVPPAAAKEG